MSNVTIKQNTNMFFSMPSQQEMHHLIDFCKVMATAPFYQKLTAGGIMAIYLTAKEHNLPFMACLNGGLYTFDGKVTFSAQLINAMIINAGHIADILHLDEQKCVIHFKRGDRKDSDYKGLVYEYNIQQAEKAGYLKKGNWITSPKDMLFSRCLTGGGRKHIPEIFVGVLVTGELVSDQSDSQIIPDVPLEAKNTIQIPINVTPASDIAELEGFSDFVSKHQLIKNVDGTMNHKMQFVVNSAEKGNMAETKVINYAMKNEADFEKKFDKWEKENYPLQVIQTQNNVEIHTSMDEVFEAM